MKSIVVPTKDNLEDYQKLGTQSFLLPLKNYAVSYPKVYSIEEIEEMKRKNPNSEFFIVMNKTIFNKDLDSLVEILEKIETFAVQGILFYDLALLEIKHRFHLKTPFVWNQTHMVTNAKTCNYYFDNEVSYAVISGELAREEIYHLIENTKMKLFYTLLSYPIVAHSRRHLLTNYAKTSNKSDKKNLVIHEKVSNQDYLIEEISEGTSFFYHALPNHFSVLKKLDVSYVVLNESYIDHAFFLQLLSSTNRYLQNEISFNEMLETVNKLLSSSAPFLDNKTIYCVKKEGR